ncbi:MAG: hypothetical protein GY950_20360, partial [bacterium]|nr:hypothetical protein [bacterium]
GFVRIKTDNQSYFEESIEAAEKYGFTRTKELPTPRPLIGENHRTFFEQLFIKQKKPVYEIFLQKI